MLYDPRKTFGKSRAIDNMLRRADHDVTEVLGERFWTNKRSDKTAELRSLLANLVACVRAKDRFDELVISRDKNQYRRRKRMRPGVGRGYMITIPLVDALVKTNWCIERRGFYDATRKTKNYRSRYMPTPKVFVGRVERESLRLVEKSPVWEVRDEHKIPILGYKFTKQERQQIEQLKHYNEFMAQVLIEVSPFRLVVDVLSGRVRRAQNLRGRFRKESYLLLDEVLACGDGLVNMVSAMSRSTASTSETSVDLLMTFVDLDSFFKVRTGDLDCSVTWHEMTATSPTFSISDPPTGCSVWPDPSPLLGTVLPDAQPLLGIDVYKVSALPRTGVYEVSALPRTDVYEVSTLPRTGVYEVPQLPGNGVIAGGRVGGYYAASDPTSGDDQYSVVFDLKSCLHWKNLSATHKLSASPDHLTVVLQCRRISSRGDSKLGARLYHDIQNLPRWYRSTILIDGEPTVELDFKGMHIVMLYHEKGLPAPADPYAIFGDDRDPIARPLVKSALLTLINAEDLPDLANAVRYNFQEKFEWSKNQWGLLNKITKACGSITEIIEAIKTFHAPIAEHFNADEGVRLQYLDSEIMLLILNQCVDLCIPAIPVHDSAVVPRRNEAVVRNIMLDAYREVMGHDIRLERK